VRRLVLPLLLGGALLAPAANASTPSAVKLDRTTVSTKIGEKFQFATTVRNLDSKPLPAVVAHLNIVSLDPAVYVDPEDWSSHRTRYLGTLPAGESRRTEWTVQAVNSGRFVVYVAAVDRNGTGSVAASNPLLATVAQNRRLNSGGVVPLAAGIPALLAFGLVLVRRRRRALI